ncbi:Fe-S oxidoreductase [Spirochaeta africana DSM 8902]|uniref:Fe-S oxidoreductase n=2 Tax=Spirochaeta TaxID=146 RepID=H9UKZ4_SPIAZ|nr:Fe-S oxidoreductase [Spirochaeta africana DSM 8902]
MHINFVSIHIAPSPRAIPLGVGMIAQSLRSQFPEEISTSLIDCYIPQDPAVQLAKVLAGNPFAVCISIFLWNSESAIRLIQDIKGSHPEVLIIAGGALPTALPDNFSSIREIDHILPGEAENSVIELFEGLLAGKPQPRIIPQGQPPRLEDVPSPYLGGLIKPAEYGGALWELSRGCPYKCSFCFESRGTTGIRRFPEDRLQKELKLFQAAGVSEIMVLDPTFNFDARIAKRNLQMMSTLAPDIHYTFEIRAEHITIELAQLFAGLNCTLQIGLQSIHPEVLNNLNRTCNTETFQKRIHLLHEQQVPYGFDLIFGLPGDSLRGFLESVDFTFSLAPNHVDIFPLAVLPGTALFDSAESLGLQFLPEGDYQVIKTPGFTPEDLSAAADIADFVDRFYNQGKAVSWFDLILEYLDLSPTGFFQIGASLADLASQPSSPLDFQYQVIHRILEHLNCTSRYPLIQDFITYFWHVNGVFAEALDASPTCGDLQFNPTLRTAAFMYNPFEIIQWIESGIHDFGIIQQYMHASRHMFAFACADSELTFLECTEKEFDFLHKLTAQCQPDFNEALDMPPRSRERFVTAGIAARSI